MTEQELKDYATGQLSSLAHKHANVSYLLIVVLVAVLTLASVGGYIAVKFADRQIARAEASEQRLVAAEKDFQKQLADNTAQRAQDTKQQAVIVKVVHDRDTSTDTAIAQALRPAKTPDAALADLENAYKGTLPTDNISVLTDSRLVFPVPVVQQFTATRLDRDRLFADRDDIKASLGLEQDKTKTLSADLKSAQGTLTDCQDTVKKWKDAAKASRFKKFFKGAGVVVAIIAAGYIGHKF